MAVDSTSGGANIAGSVFLGGFGTLVVAGGTSAVLRNARDTARYDEALTRSVAGSARQASDLGELAKPLADARKGILEHSVGSVLGEWKMTSFGSASPRAVRLFDQVAGQQTLQGARIALDTGLERMTQRADRLGVARGSAKALAWVGGIAAMAAFTMPRGSSVSEVSEVPMGTSPGDDY